MKNSSFDHWLRQNLKDSNASLDIEKEWELLEPKLKKNKSRRRLIFWILFPAVIGALGSLYYFGEVTATERNLITDPINEMPIKLYEDHDQNTIKRDEILLDIPAMKQGSKSINNLATNHSQTLEPKNSNSNIVNNPDWKDYKINSSQITQETALPQTSNQTVLNTTKPIQKILNPGMAGVDEQANWSGSKSESTDFISFKKTNIQIEKNQNDLSEISKFRQPTKISTNKINIPLYVQTMGSMGILKQYLDGPPSTLNIRMASEKPVSAYGTSIMAHTILRRKYGLGLGIDYQFHTLRFTQNFKDTLTKTLYGQVLAEKVNSNSEIIQDTGNITINEYRSVSRKLYHNRTIISIPFALSYIQKINRTWSWSYNLGLSLPIYLKYNGRISNQTANSIELDSYGENISLFMLPCSVLYGVAVDYHIRPELKFVLGLQGISELGFWKDSETGIREKHGSLNLQAGMCYRLK